MNPTTFMSTRERYRRPRQWPSILPATPTSRRSRSNLPIGQCHPDNCREWVSTIRERVSRQDRSRGRSRFGDRASGPRFLESVPRNVRYAANGDAACGRHPALNIGGSLRAVTSRKPAMQRGSCRRLNLHGQHKLHANRGRIVQRTRHYEQAGILRSIDMIGFGLLPSLNGAALNCG